MAKFRKIHTTFWDDSYIEKLSAEDRYFFLFLMTNPLCTECGIYSITLKKMVYWSGYNEESIKAILKRFIEAKRIAYDTLTDEICIINKPNYIDKLGKPVIDCLNSELGKVKSKILISTQLAIIKRIEIRNVYDTWTIRGEEEEKEEEENIIPKGISGATAPVSEISEKELKEKYKKAINDKDQLINFIQKYKPCFAEPYAKYWNLFATQYGFPKVDTLNDSRRKKLKTRCKEESFDFIKLIQRAETSNLDLTKGWLTFDWILSNDTNYVKLLEGNYEKQKQKSSNNQTKPDDLLEQQRQKLEKQKQKYA